MANDFKIIGKIWRWPGDIGWHFINVDKTISVKIRTKYPKGFVKICVRIGDATWNTSLFPHKEFGHYLMAIKQSIRKKENLFEGDTVKISFTIL
jgi:hypothetical protein